MLQWGCKIVNYPVGITPPPRCISGSVPHRDKIQTAIPMFSNINFSAVPLQPPLGSLYPKFQDGDTSRCTSGSVPPGDKIPMDIPMFGSKLFNGPHASLFRCFHYPKIWDGVNYPFKCISGSVPSTLCSNKNVHLKFIFFQ